MESDLPLTPEDFVGCDPYTGLGEVCPNFGLGETVPYGVLPLAVGEPEAEGAADRGLADRGLAGGRLTAGGAPAGDWDLSAGKPGGGDWELPAEGPGGGDWELPAEELGEDDGLELRGLEGVCGIMGP
jgi:hypothetical protein